MPWPASSSVTGLSASARCLETRAGSAAAAAHCRTIEPALDAFGPTRAHDSSPWRPPGRTPPDLSEPFGIAPDGRWVHVLHCESSEAYAKTGKALFGKPGVGGWIRSLDFQRFEVSRGDDAGR